LQAPLDCFAEPVIGPRDVARVRWLEMTRSRGAVLRPSFVARQGKASRANKEHDREKWSPVFGSDHAP
jgi:hypothetical protein